LVQALRAVAPVLPFLCEHLWQNLVSGVCPDAPRSVFLAGWPAAPAEDGRIRVEMEEVRRVVELGHRARAQAGLKLRQPLRRLVAQGVSAAERHVDQIRDELRVKEVEFGPVEAAELRVKPNLPVLGPKLGKELGVVRSALAAGDFEYLPGGGVRVAGLELGPDEVLVERGARPGWAIAEHDGLVVAVATELDDELERGARVLELVHAVNRMRKELGLELTDRIVLTLPDADRDLLAHE